MEGKIEDFLNLKHQYNTPYQNHYGYGDDMGCGDIDGSGRAFVETTVKENYNGSDFLYFNGNKVYCVNGYILYITHIRDNWAMGEIIKNDLTTQKCYLGKLNNFIVVSDSIRGAFELLKEHLTNKKNNEDYFNENFSKAFVKAHPYYDKEYDSEEVAFWHTMHSCTDGIKKFTDLNHKGKGTKITPKEMIESMKSTIAYKLADEIEKCYLNNDN